VLIKAKVRTRMHMHACTCTHAHARMHTFTCSSECLSLDCMSSPCAVHSTNNLAPHHHLCVCVYVCLFLSVYICMYA
jgi:hypothetical protein